MAPLAPTRHPRTPVAALALLIALAVLLVPSSARAAESTESESAEAAGTFALTGVVIDYDALEVSGVTVTALPVSPTPASYTVTKATDADGRFRLDLRPGRYRVRYAKTGFQTSYVGTNPTTPVDVVVSTAGAITARLLEITDGEVEALTILRPAPTLKKAPQLTGRLAPGQRVTTTFGTWTPDTAAWVRQGNGFVEWFLNGRPADDFSDGTYGNVFVAPAGAVGKVLTYRVTVLDPSGRRGDAMWTGRAGTVAKAAATISGVVSKGALKVSVKVPGVAPTGKVTVLEGGRPVGSTTLTAARKGVAVVSLAGLKRGKHTLTVAYAGSSAVKAARKVVRVSL